MALLRYAAQEARNISRARAKAEQQAKVDAFVQARKAKVSITKSDLGLGSVDNTADADKPVSNATSEALAGKLEWTPEPLSAVSPGIAGQIAYCSGFLYVCVAPDTWQRAVIAAW